MEERSTLGSLILEPKKEEKSNLCSTIETKQTFKGLMEALDKTNEVEVAKKGTSKYLRSGRDYSQQERRGAEMLARAWSRWKHVCFWPHRSLGMKVQGPASDEALAWGWRQPPPLPPSPCIALPYLPFLLPESLTSGWS